MRIDHLYGRSVADTAAMAALTGRTPWSVRTVCTRQEEGYDVDICTAVLQANPIEPDLVTAAQAEHRFGVPSGHVRQSAYRGRLTSYQTDPQGFPLYDAATVQAMHAAAIAYQEKRRKTRRNPPA